ncbi:histidine-rich glycoprotein [Ochotona curzoniae]|uniref:histidine-rich glycoprotein n=1 Tax=Ochotona curzoniae TaxID=130825 RepID=UPI001B346004|nr:histidine-rich glycoprotein [Ochotona curzoniae]
MKALAAALLLATLHCSWAVTPTDCNAVKPVAEKALDLINKGRRDGYIFQLLRVADAHLDGAESATVYYLVLDVKETDCSVLTRKHWEDCESTDSRRPDGFVIGQCKVIATRYSNEFQFLKLNDFNCTISSVSSALANSKDSPVLLDFIEDTEPFKKPADKALDVYKKEHDDFASFRVDRIERAIRVKGGERTNVYVDFSVRNCSRSHFHKHPDFGFCKADLSYSVGASDLENPENIVINCEVFNFEDHRNISGFESRLGHPFHFGGHKHPHKPHKSECPPSQEGKDFSDGPPLPGEARSSGPRCRHRPFGANETHRFPHHRNFSEHHSQRPPPHGHPHHKPPPHGHPHGHPPHGPPPHGHPPHGPPPHGHLPHGPPPHGHPPHGRPPHGHPPHGPPPHGHPPHGPPPHGHPPHGPPPHGHGFHDHGPCDPPLQRQDPQDPHEHGHGPPPKHPGKRGPGKGHFHGRPFGNVYQLPPLQKGEVLPLPEANFPSFSLRNHTHPLKPEIQPFPQSASELCPGEFKSEFSQLSRFFASTVSK